MQEDYQDGLDMNPAETQYKLDAQAQVPLYKHQQTGVITWRRAIELASSRYRADETTLLFHYTTKGNFYAICSAAYVTPELWSALKDTDGSVHGLMEEPDQLGTKAAIAAMAPVKTNATTSSPYTFRNVASGVPSANARYCLAVLAPKDLIRSAATQPGANGAAQTHTIVCPDEAACLKLACSKSEQRLKRILEARQAALGAEHPETLMGSNDLAALIVAQGRFAEAEPMYRRTLQCLQARMGQNHPDALRTACNLAALLAAMGNTSEAEKLYRHAAQGLEAELGPKNLDTLYCLSKLAQVLKTRGYAQESEQYLQRVVKGMNQKLGAQHPDTLCNVAALASVMEQLGRAQEAEPVQNKALDGFKADSTRGFFSG
ncbi:unnamed protein product [Effrenium voratum]|nr:unnamed protein product [Effrenium voratum]